MLQRYNGKISSIICLFAHCGKEADEGSRIYEAAASSISPAGHGESFFSPVRYRKTTERDYRISGVSRETLHGAPTFADVSAFLLPLFRKTNIVVTLNSPDEIQPLLSVCGNPRVVDLRFAAEFFLPQVNTASLKSIWEHLHATKRDKFSFSADEARELSVELLKHICGFVLNQETFEAAPALRYYLRKSDTLFGNLLTTLNADFQGYFGGLFNPAGGEETANWQSFLKKPPPRTPVHQKCGQEERKAVSLPHLEDIYHALSAKTKTYKIRQTQIAYARHVATALNNKEILTIEAGTGTGKTQGYLIPAFEFLHKNPDARIAISTYTKNLQEQIVRREIPLAVSLKPDYAKIPVAMLKGKSNYLCAEKLDHIYDDALTGDKLLLWLYFINRIYYFRDVDGDATGERIRLHLNDGYFFRRMMHEASARSGCTFRHSRCPAQVVAAEALNARLVITNHHKLALINKDGQLSNIFRNCIIDEANHFEHAVRGAFALDVSSRELSDSVAYVENALMRIPSFQDGSPGKQAAAAFEAIDAIAALREETAAFSAAIASLRGASRSGEAAIIPAAHPSFTDGLLKRQLLAMRKTLKKIAVSLSFLKDPEAAPKLGIHPRTAGRLLTGLQDLEENADTLKAIADVCDNPEFVVSAVLYVHHWTVSARAVEVAEILRTHLYKTWETVIFTSATLRQGTSFQGFMSIAGMTPPPKQPSSSAPPVPPLNHENGENSAPGTWSETSVNACTPPRSKQERSFRFEAIPSPFDPAAFLITVPPGAASGAHGSKESWLASVAELLPELIRENRGRTLVLFASYQDLQETVSRTGDDIRALGYPLLIQESGASTNMIVDEFREIRESVLFGVDSFWFGVDFPGDTLTQVVITRLPYPHPQEPLHLARRNILPESEYWNRYRYETEIKLKQGIGRLIRSEADSGRIVILDTRYRSYGRSKDRRRD